MQKFLLLLLLTFSNSLSSQEYTYSFTASSKSFQKTDSNGKIIDYSLWKPTDTIVEITEEKCIVNENGVIQEFQILSSQLKKDGITRIEIKAKNSNQDYGLELAVIDINKFMFLIDDNRGKIEIYKTNELSKKRI